MPECRNVFAFNWNPVDFAMRPMKNENGKNANCSFTVILMTNDECCAARTLRGKQRYVISIGCWKLQIAAEAHHWFFAQIIGHSMNGKTTKINWFRFGSLHEWTLQQKRRKLMKSPRPNQYCDWLLWVRWLRVINEPHHVPRFGVSFAA